MGRRAMGQAAARAAAEEALGAIERELAAVRGEIASALSLRYGSDVPDIGGVFSHGQILTQMVFDALTVQDAGLSLSRGAAAPAMSAGQRARAEDLAAAARQTAAAVPEARMEAIRPELEGLSLAHNERHAAPLRRAVDGAERAAADEDAGTVPIEEPAGRPPSAAGVALVVAALALVLWGVS